MKKALFLIPVRQSFGKNMVYYGVIFLTISTAFLFATGMSPQTKAALIIECLFPLFASLIVVDAGLIDRYVGSWEIVLSSMNNPYLFLHVRFGGIFVALFMLLLVVSGVSVALSFNSSPFGLALSSFLNTLSLSVCGVGIALLWKTSLISYIVVLGLSAISIQLAPMIPLSWQLFPHLFGQPFSAGLPLRLFQLLLIIIVPFLISWKFRYDQ